MRAAASTRKSVLINSPRTDMHLGDRQVGSPLGFDTTQSRASIEPGRNHTGIPSRRHVLGHNEYSLVIGNHAKHPVLCRKQGVKHWPPACPNRHTTAGYHGLSDTWHRVARSP